MQRYFITAESTYEDLRQSLNAQLAYPNSLGKTVFQTALHAPRDRFRRVLLAVDTDLPNYAAISSAIAPLTESDAMEEIDEATYLAAVASSALVEGGGSYDQSLNTADSPTFAGLTLTGATSGISYNHLSDLPTLGNAASWDIGNEGGTIAAGDDPRFGDAREPTSHAASHVPDGSDPLFDQSLNQADSPTFAGLTLTGPTTGIEYGDLNNVPTLFSGDYNDLSNQPTLFSGNYADLTGAPTLSTVATSGDYNDLSNQPTLFSGDYDDLSNRPSFSAVATSGDYNDLDNVPTLGTAAAFDVGTVTGTVAAGDDARFTDARTPTSHSHAPADITFSATDRLLGRSTAGGGAGAEITCTAFGRSLIADPDAATARTTLGLGSVATLSNVSRLVQQSISATTVNNTTAESNLLSFSQTAVADNCVYRVHAFGTILNNSGSTVTYTLRFKVGATTVLATTAVGRSAGAQRRRWRTVFDVVMAGGRASQVVSAQHLETEATSTNWALTQANNVVSFTGYNTATEDMATAKTIVYTVQLGTANANAEMVCNGFYVEELVT